VEGKAATDPAFGGDADATVALLITKAKIYVRSIGRDMHCS